MNKINKFIVISFLGASMLPVTIHAQEKTTIRKQKIDQQLTIQVATSSAAIAIGCGLIFYGKLLSSASHVSHALPDAPALGVFYNPYKSEYLKGRIISKVGWFTAAMGGLGLLATSNKLIFNNKKISSSQASQE